MRIVNVNIPPWFPNQAYLSVPLLTGILRHEGYSVYQKDLNLSFYDNLLSKNELEYQFNTLIKSNTFIIDKKKQSLVDLKNYFIDNIEKLKNQTRRIDSFEDKEFSHRVYQDLELALKIFTIAFPNIELSFGEVRYCFNHLDIETVSKFLDSGNNLFKYYFTKYELFNIIDYNPDIIAISITTPEQLIPAFTLANLVRSENPDVKVLFGGDYISRVYLALINHPVLNTLFNYILIGQIEESIISLFSSLKSKTDLTKVPSLIWKNNNEFIVNPLNESFDYSKTPHPDFDGLQLKKYFFPEIYLPIEVSKGCYWSKCVFCEIKGKHYIEKSANQIVDEMNFQHSKYGNTFFSFVSSSPSPKLLFEISKSISSRNFKWSAFIRPEAYIDENFAKVFYDGGCRILYIGIESGSQKVVNAMNKGSEISKTIAVLQNFKKAGIKVHAYFMFGFTSETDQDRNETISFINQNRDLFHSISLSGYVEPYSKDEIDCINIYKPYSLNNSFDILIQTIVKKGSRYYYNLNLEIIYET